MMLMMLAANTEMQDFVKSILESVTGEITLAGIGLVVAAIITAGIVAIFTWKFARKGYAFIVKALAGQSGKV